jgi:hypothetical protein
MARGKPRRRGEAQAQAETWTFEGACDCGQRWAGIKSSYPKLKPLLSEAHSHADYLGHRVTIRVVSVKLLGPSLVEQCRVH